MDFFRNALVNAITGDWSVTRGLTPEQKKTYQMAKELLDSNEPISWTKKFVEGQGRSMLHPAETTYFTKTGGLNIAVTKMEVDSGIEQSEQYFIELAPQDDLGPESPRRVTLENSGFAEEFYVRAENELEMEAASMPPIPAADGGGAAAVK